MFSNRKVFFVVMAVAATILCISVIQYWLILSSPSDVEVSSPQIVGDISYVHTVDSVQFLVVEGVVQNNLNMNTQVNVTVAFVDAENNILKELSSSTMLKILKPGQKSSFTFYWPLDSSEIKYQLDLTYTLTSDQPVDVLEFVHVANKTEDEQYVIRGEVWNKRSFEAFGVAVVCAYYGVNGSFSGLSRDFISSIVPGGTSPFEISINVSENPAYYDLMVYASNYEDSSSANLVLFAVLILGFLAFTIFMKRRGW